MCLMNFTPHEINIIDVNSVNFNQTIRKFVSEDPLIIQTIPPSGVMLNVHYSMENGTRIKDIPVRIKRKESIDPVPSKCTIAIVSRLYASASHDPRLYRIMDPVFTPDGKKVIGSLAIGRIVN